MRWNPRPQPSFEGLSTQQLLVGVGLGLGYIVPVQLDQRSTSFTTFSPTAAAPLQCCRLYHPDSRPLGTVEYVDNDGAFNLRTQPIASYVAGVLGCSWRGAGCCCAAPALLPPSPCAAILSPAAASNCLVFRLQMLTRARWCLASKLRSTARTSPHPTPPYR